MLAILIFQVNRATSGRSHIGEGIAYGSAQPSVCLLTIRTMSIILTNKTLLKAWYGYGNYYIRVSNSVGDRKVAFKIKYYIKDCAACQTTLITPPYQPAANETWEWISDGEVKFGNVSQDQYVTFRYFSDQKCTNFSVSGRRQANAAADIDVYISMVNPYPTLENHQWNGNMCVIKKSCFFPLSTDFWNFV